MEDHDLGGALGRSFAGRIRWATSCALPPARAAELSTGDDPNVGTALIGEARQGATPILIDVLCRSPLAPAGTGPRCASDEGVEHPATVASLRDGLPGGGVGLREPLQPGELRSGCGAGWQFWPGRRPRRPVASRLSRRPLRRRAGAESGRVGPRGRCRDRSSYGGAGQSWRVGEGSGARCRNGVGGPGTQRRDAGPGARIYLRGCPPREGPVRSRGVRALRHSGSLVCGGTGPTGWTARCGTRSRASTQSTHRPSIVGRNSISRPIERRALSRHPASCRGLCAPTCERRSTTPRATPGSWAPTPTIWHCPPPSSVG